MDLYDVGDVLPLTCTFRNASGDLADPTDVRLEILAPDGTETTFVYSGLDITRTSLGLYTRDVTFTASGTWSWRWTGTGAVGAVDEGSLRVRESVFE